jgi:hypothetical protein
VHETIKDSADYEHDLKYMRMDWEKYEKFQNSQYPVRYQVLTVAVAELLSSGI